jgi:hypothetical protein
MPSFKQKDGPTMFGTRHSTDMPINDEFYKIELVWRRPWSVILPENFSALVVHPLNRIDLPFVTMSGVVDFDKSIHAPIGNIPFFVKKGFEGVIPAGTPMLQIIPIQRFDWESKVHEHDSDFWKEKAEERSNISDFYKKKIWQRKQFD